MYFTWNKYKASKSGICCKLKSASSNILRKSWLSTNVLSYSQHNHTLWGSPVWNFHQICFCVCSAVFPQWMKMVKVCVFKYVECKLIFHWLALVVVAKQGQQTHTHTLRWWWSKHDNATLGISSANLPRRYSALLYIRQRRENECKIKSLLTVIEIGLW